MQQTKQAKCKRLAVFLGSRIKNIFRHAIPCALAESFSGNNNKKKRKKAKQNETRAKGAGGGG